MLRKNPAHLAHLGLHLGDGLGLVLVVDVVLDEGLERLVRPVADVRLVRVRVVPPVDAHRREGVDVLRASREGGSQQA